MDIHILFGANDERGQVWPVKAYFDPARAEQHRALANARSHELYRLLRAGEISLAEMVNEHDPAMVASQETAPRYYLVSAELDLESVVAEIRRSLNHLEAASPEPYGPGQAVFGEEVLAPLNRALMGLGQQPTQAWLEAEAG